MPPCAVTIACDQGEAEAGAAASPRVRGRVAAGEPLEGVLGQLRREARAVVVDREADPWRRADATVTVVPARGVLAGVGQQVGDHLVQPLLVAGDLDRLVGQVEPPAVVGRDHAGVGDRLDQQPGQVDRRRAPAAGRRRAGRAAAGPRPARTSAPDSASTLPSAVRHVRRVVGRGAGRARRSRAIVVSGVRSSWEASATNCRTCCSLAVPRGQRATRRARAACSGAAPTWPTSVRSSVRSLGHPLGEPISPVGQRQLGDRVRGRGDLAQRPQLAAYDDQAGAAGGRDAEQRRAAPPTQIRLATASSTVRGRQPGDDLTVAGGSAGRGDAVARRSPASVDACALAVGAGRAASVRRGRCDERSACRSSSAICAGAAGVPMRDHARALAVPGQRRTDALSRSSSPPGGGPVRPGRRSRAGGRCEAPAPRSSSWSVR